MLKLILLPGMDGTGKLFESLANRLSATYEIEVVEYPTDRCLSYTELKSLVQSVIPISRSFVLLAESFSTPLAVTIAADNPSNLKGLILCTGFVSRPLLGWRRFIASYLAPILLSRPVPDSAIRAFLADSSASRELLTAIRSAVASVDPKVLSDRLHSILTCDVRTDLDKIHSPVFYLQATRDRLVSPSCFEAIRGIKPGVTAAQIAGPHLIL